MKCPVCGRDVDKNSNSCPFCGASLYGPRSINLNMPDGSMPNAQDNNIGRITGIDINSLPKGELPPMSDKEKAKIDKKKMNKFLDVSSKVVMVASLILFAVSIIMYFKNKDDKPECPKQTCPKVKKDYYGSIGVVQFLVPEGFEYQTSGNSAAVTDGNLSIIINGTINYNFMDLTTDKLVNFYKEKGYLSATYLEDALDQKTIKLVQFSASNRKFYDFFYGLEDNIIVYGQLSAIEGDVLTEDSKKVISSLKLIEKEHTSITKVTIDYEDLFKNR